MDLSFIRVVCIVAITHAECYHAIIIIQLDDDPQQDIHVCIYIPVHI